MARNGMAQGANRGHVTTEIVRAPKKVHSKGVSLWLLLRGVLSTSVVFTNWWMIRIWRFVADLQGAVWRFYHLAAPRRSRQADVAFNCQMHLSHLLVPSNPFALAVSWAENIQESDHGTRIVPWGLRFGSLWASYFGYDQDRRFLGRQESLQICQASSGITQACFGQERANQGSQLCSTCQAKSKINNLSLSSVVISIMLVVQTTN